MFHAAKILPLAISLYYLRFIEQLAQLVAAQFAKQSLLVSGFFLALVTHPPIAGQREVAKGGGRFVERDVDERERAVFDVIPQTESFRHPGEDAVIERGHAAD